MSRHMDGLSVTQRECAVGPGGTLSRPHTGGAADAAAGVHQTDACRGSCYPWGPRCWPGNCSRARRRRSRCGRRRCRSRVSAARQHLLTRRDMRPARHRSAGSVARLRQAPQPHGNCCRVRTQAEIAPLLRSLRGAPFVLTFVLTTEPLHRQELTGMRWCRRGRAAEAGAAAGEGRRGHGRPPRPYWSRCCPAGRGAGSPPRSRSRTRPPRCCPASCARAPRPPARSAPGRRWPRALGSAAESACIHVETLHTSQTRLRRTTAARVRLCCMQPASLNIALHMLLPTQGAQSVCVTPSAGTARSRRAR